MSGGVFQYDDSVFTGIGEDEILGPTAPDLVPVTSMPQLPPPAAPAPTKASMSTGDKLLLVGGFVVGGAALWALGSMLLDGSKKGKSAKRNRRHRDDEED